MKMYGWMSSSTHSSLRLASFKPLPHYARRSLTTELCKHSAGRDTWARIELQFLCRPVRRQLSYTLKKVYLTILSSCKFLSVNKSSTSRTTFSNPVIRSVNPIAVTGMWWLGYATYLVCCAAKPHRVSAERQCPPISLFLPSCCYTPHWKIIVESFYKLRCSYSWNFVDSILTFWRTDSNYPA
jgi:hypothetical protein